MSESSSPLLHNSALKASKSCSLCLTINLRQGAGLLPEDDHNYDRTLFYQPFVQCVAAVPKRTESSEKKRKPAEEG